jgi:hypothetical protein
MKQIRIAKRHLRPARGRQTSLPLDPRDPDIVRAHRAARQDGGARAGRTQPGGRAGTTPDRNDR